MSKNLELLQTLSARICHDFAGSIGIIDNCLSLIEESDQNIASKAKILLHEESKNLVQKIRFFRECYGVSVNNDDMSSDYVAQIITDFFANNAIVIKFHFSKDVVFLNNAVGKAFICLVVIASEHITLHGKMDLFIEDGLFKIVTKAERLKLQKDKFLVFKNELPITVENCLDYYISALCKETGFNVVVREFDDGFEYILKK